MKNSLKVELQQGFVLLSIITFMIIFIAANMKYVDVIKNDIDTYYAEIIEHQIYKQYPKYEKNSEKAHVDFFDIIKSGILQKSFSIYPQLDDTIYKMEFTPSFSYYHFIMTPIVVSLLIILIFYYFTGTLLQRGIERMKDLRLFMHIFLTEGRVDEVCYRRLCMYEDEIFDIAKSLKKMMHKNCEEQRKAEELHKKMEHIALHDTLTSLPNRKLLFDRLEQTIKRAKREGFSFGLLFFDLNKFKLINDRIGHEAGDLVLQKFAHRLTNIFRESDTFARIGGDEFVAILAPSDEESIKRVIEKVHTALKTPLCYNGKEITMNTSIGVAMYPDNAVKTNDLLRLADKAMYRAKQEALPYAFAASVDMIK